MPLSDNEKRILQIETEKEIIFKHLENSLISQPFTEDFARRFSWSTNAIEGNTLSLEETIAVIDYDEVRSNHTYSEYTDVKKVYYAIREMLLPFKKTMIDEELKCYKQMLKTSFETMWDENIELRRRTCPKVDTSFFLRQKPKMRYVFCALNSSPQSHMASRMGFRLRPSSVREYSTRGGTSG